MAAAKKASGVGAIKTHEDRPKSAYEQYKEKIGMPATPNRAASALAGAKRKPAAPPATKPKADIATPLASLGEIIVSAGMHVDKLREEGNVEGLVKSMARIKQLGNQLKAITSAQSALLDRIRFSHLPDLFDEKGIEKITVADVGTCYLSDDIQVTVLDKDGLKQWLIDNLLEDMIQDSVNAQTLAAFIRAQNKLKPEEGRKDVPSEIVETRPFTRAAIKTS
jgi:hypothetical protein